MKTRPGINVIRTSGTRILAERPPFTRNLPDEKPRCFSTSRATEGNPTAGYRWREGKSRDGFVLLRDSTHLSGGTTYEKFMPFGVEGTQEEKMTEKSSHARKVENGEIGEVGGGTQQASENGKTFSQSFGHR
ncbi:MAG: hypothetical protein HYY20_04400 [Candidatus Tectomicrobia bacterium]|uniref:Uncharacterized protein n=1 Tax=Tectimicrobiota bacterium TaxID=2528274 RepID=A0A932CMD0_UNCTE|nr:hypothetical protein [Candidatus Tectomicrobia bacterium]